MTDPLTEPTVDLPILPLARRHSRNFTVDAVDVEQDSDALEVTTPAGEILTLDPAPFAQIVDERVRIVMTRFQGPIPMPEQLAAYDQLAPGAADRLIAMAEREQQHRIDMERVRVQEPMRAVKRGQLLGFGVVVAVLAAATYMVHDGHAATGGILGGLDLVALAAVFLASGAGRKRSDDVASESEDH